MDEKKREGTQSSQDKDHKQRDPKAIKPQGKTFARRGTEKRG